jgi:type IV secretory pathway VirB2 component (pilin)
MHVGAGWPQMGRRTNGLAIAALCCAIGQVIAGPFAGIAAIVLGLLSLKQIRLSGQDGRGMAITGLVLGIVGTILAVLLIVMALALFHGLATNVNNLNNLNN